ncbi:hypothetical protein C9374_008795 [Naegleria lovaniensis]|uniref:Uncharacterized protein n=1 Tax=Naegleria lovaniensis TaxID=51637 RepID=A0AA88KFD8_NAELO|nr:uncharacterized protein C9374_008795 [Naegleria lovaniensis]KAG2377710.1 hypothetical protein C9374_008795 [Naegleria lovaniensis]
MNNDHDRTCAEEGFVHQNYNNDQEQDTPMNNFPSSSTQQNELPIGVQNESSSNHLNKRTKSSNSNLFVPKQVMMKQRERTINPTTDSSEKNSLINSLLPPNKTKITLPIMEYSQTIVRAIEEHQVVIVTGNTGSGKTTQVPQLILKHYLENGDVRNLANVKIICTQPRRIAATSLSRRVNSEMKEYLEKQHFDNIFHHGKMAGYIIGGEHNIDNDTPIIFATEGCLTQIIMNLQTGSKGTYETFHKHFSHIILDEIHERKVDTDLLLYFVREIVKVNPNVRVILMSATISHQKLCTYFETVLLDVYNNVENTDNDDQVPESPGFSQFLSFETLQVSSKVPIIHIPSGCYPVQEYFIEDVIDLVYPKAHNVSKTIPNYNTLLTKPLRPGITLERRKLAVSLIAKLHTEHALNAAILIFLPGMVEIEDFMDDLASPYITMDECPYDIHILHSLVAEQEQDAALLPSKPGKRKIILSTNIAESSITVPDVVIVIDFCLYKGKFWNESWNAEVMGVNWISSQSAKQREGRAGRVSPGICCRMITKSEYEMLDESVVPEIQRKPLTGVILQILMFTGAYEKEETDPKRKIQTKFQAPSEVLSNCLDPPKMVLLEHAYRELLSLGAIVPIQTGTISQATDKSIVEQYELQESYLVTKIGKFLSLMQIELKLSFIILLGYCLGILPECMITVAILSRSVPVLTFSYLKILTAKALFAFSNQSESDVIAGIHAFNRFKSLSMQKKQNRMRQREFYETLQIEMISSKSALEIESLIAQICHTLFKHYGIYIENLTSTSASTHKRNIRRIAYTPQIIGELAKTHTVIPKEIVCSLKLRKQKLVVDKDSQLGWNEAFSELFKYFDGGILSCKTLTVSPSKVSLSYPIPHSDENLLIPYPPNCKTDPLFPLKLLARTVRGSAQEKGKDILLTLSQVKQSMVCIRDDSDVYGVFRTLPNDLIKSHVLKFLSVEAKPYQRKTQFLHPQMSSSDKAIISRDSVAYPWVDLQHKQRILVPSSISMKEMGIVIEKNTILPPIQGFYEMSLLLFIPLIYPQKFFTYIPNVEDLEQAYEIRVGNFAQNIVISGVSDTFSSLAEHEKPTPYYYKTTIIQTCSSFHTRTAYNTEFIISDLKLTRKLQNFFLAKLFKQFIHTDQCGYNQKTARILKLESIDGPIIEHDDEENHICGTSILRMSEIAKISDRTLKMIADRSTSTDSPIDILRRVFEHPKQAFIMIETSKTNATKLLSSKIFFCKHDDITGKNRDFFTINSIHFTSKHHHHHNTKLITIDENKEHHNTKKALKSEVLSEKLTSGGFLLEPFAKKHVISAFNKKSQLPSENAKFSMNAYFGKQVFYASRLGSTNISQSQKSLTLNDFRNMKIGNENDLKALFLPYVDYCSHPKWNITKAYVESLGDPSKKVSFFSDHALFQPLLSQVKPTLGIQKEIISMGIVDTITSTRYNLSFSVDREMVFTENEIFMYKCKLEHVRPPEIKLLYLSCVSPCTIDSHDTEESVKTKNVNSVDVRFSKTLQTVVDETTYMNLLRPEILQFADSIWYDEDNYTLYYLFEDKNNKSYTAIDLVQLNLAFGSTVPDIMSQVRQQTPLATLSMDSASYTIEERLHETATTFILTFRHVVDICNPFKRQQRETVHEQSTGLETNNQP